MLGCRLAYAARSVRRASSVAFGEFWSSLKAQVETFPGFAEGTVSSTIELPLDDSRRMVSMEGRVMNAVGYVYNRHLNKMIACPRAGDLPGEHMHETIHESSGILSLSDLPKILRTSLKSIRT